MNSLNIFSEILNSRETLLLELRDNIEHKIQPMVLQARKSLAVNHAQKIAYHNHAGLLSEIIEKLGNLCQRIDSVTADQLFVSRIHQALQGCQTEKNIKIQVIGSTVLTSAADQENILRALYRITALCKTSACCIQGLQLIMKSNEQRIILTTIQDAVIQAETFCNRLETILESEKLKLVRTITIGVTQVIHLSKHKN